MGGPCKLCRRNPKATGARILKKDAPACTDNFQIVEGEFRFAGREWHSVEQCYQAVKYAGVDREAFDRIHQCTPGLGESDFDYGQTCWRLGQTAGSSQLNWDGVKVRVMFDMNCEKFLQHPEYQESLRTTGDQVIYGGPSTWHWSTYNGLIQSLIRNLVNEGRLEGYKEVDLSAEFVSILEGYKDLRLVKAEFCL